jgi:hypothetical protein
MHHSRTIEEGLALLAAEYAEKAEIAEAREAAAV